MFVMFWLGTLKFLNGQEGEEAVIITIRHEGEPSYFEN